MILDVALAWLSAFTSLSDPEIFLTFLPILLTHILPLLAHPSSRIRKEAIECAGRLYQLVWDVSEPLSMIDFRDVVNSVTLLFLNENDKTRVASVEWLLMLHRKAPSELMSFDESVFPALLKLLSDSSNEVVRRDLQFIAQIASSSHTPSSYFSRFINSLLSLFSADRRLLETRGSLIIRELCVSLDSEKIFSAFATALETEADLEFASLMILNLNLILVTSEELVGVRKRLRTALDSKNGAILFQSLYKSWSHNSVATLCLCLLAQAYEHAAALLQLFAELEITVTFLIQVDKLVQLLESPVFTCLILFLLLIAVFTCVTIHLK